MRTLRTALLAAVVSAGLLGCRRDRQTETPASASALLVAPPIVVSTPTSTSISLPVTSKARRAPKPRGRIG